jgi:hypothetical protein
LHPHDIGKASNVLETIYVEFSFAIVKDSEGRVLGALATARDITGSALRRRHL